MTIRLGQESTPATPSAGKAEIFFDSSDGRLKAVLPGGAVHTFSDVGRVQNALANGGMWFAQRQDPTALTTYSNTSGRAYSADRWAITNENASVQYQRVDVRATPEAGFSAPFYGKLVKTTSAGKIVFSQALEGVDVAPLRGRRVSFQCKLKNVVGSHTIRLALLQLTSAGTLDTIPGTFVSAFGAAGTDPTWGTNLAAITPSIALGAGSVSGSGVSCVLTSSWQRFGGSFVVPSDAKNIVAVLFTNGQPAASDSFALGELMLLDGDELREWSSHDQPHELTRCQRYFWKTFNIDTAPAQNVGAATAEFRFPCLGPPPTISRGGSVFFATRMRAVPTVTTYNPAAANAEARDLNAGATCTSTAAFNVNDRSLAIQAAGAATSVLANILGLHISCEAEL